MTRNPFGGTTADFVYSTKVVQGDTVMVPAGASLTFYDAQTAGNQIVDLQDAGGAAITTVTVGSDGNIPVFYGPDSVTQMWASANGGPRDLMVSAQAAASAVSNAQTSATNAAASASAAASSATAAQNAAASVPATTDAAVAPLVPSSSGSATSEALSAAYASRGKRPERQFPGGTTFSPSVSDRSRHFLCWGLNGEIIATSLIHQSGGPYAIEVSTDTGQTWTRRTVPWTVSTFVERAWVVSTGTMFVLVGNTLYRSVDLGATWDNGGNPVLTLPTSVSILMRGLARHSDGNVYVAEYATTSGAYLGGNAIIHASADDGVTWTNQASFPSSMDGNSGGNTVRHLHGVHSLPSGLYLTTGDNNTECAIYKLISGTWTRQTPAVTDANGAQRWRSVDLQERNGYIYWGRDASGISQSEVGKAPTSDLSAYQQLATLQTGCWTMDQTSDGIITIGGEPTFGAYDADSVIRLWTVDGNDVVREALRIPSFPGSTGQAELDHRVNGKTVGLSTFKAVYDDAANGAGLFQRTCMIGTLVPGTEALEIKPASAARQPILDPTRPATPARTYPNNVIGPVGTWTTTSGLATGAEFATPIYVADDCQIKSAAVYVQTAGGAGAVVRIGLRTDNGGVPGGLAVEFGTIDATTTGGKTVQPPGAKNLILPRGIYWVTTAIQGAPNPVPVLVTRTGLDPYVPQGGTGALFTSGRNGLSQSGVTGALPMAWSNGANAPQPYSPVVWLTRS